MSLASSMEKDWRTRMEVAMLIFMPCSGFDEGHGSWAWIQAQAVGTQKCQWF